MTRAIALCCLVVATITTSMAAGLTGTYYSDDAWTTRVHQDVNPQVKFDWGTRAPLPGMAANHFSVRWTGAVTPPVTGNYSFVIRGTHTWRLWVNNALVTDLSAFSVYYDDYKKNRLWDRGSEVVVALSGKIPVNLTLEYRKADQGQPTPARITLSWYGPGSPVAVVPAKQLSPYTVTRQPQLARPARDFYESIGVNIEQASIRDPRFQARLAELGVYSVRGGLYGLPDDVRADILKLYQTHGVKYCGLVRESWIAGDPNVTGEALQATIPTLLRDIKTVAPALVAVEGPNEVNIGGERFCYRGHGTHHETSEPVGEGWALGISYFMRDLYSAMKSNVDLRTIPVAMGTVSGGTWMYPNSGTMWNAVASKFHLDIGAYCDVGNYHKYHMSYPDHPRHQDMLYRLTRQVIHNFKPYIITEMGYNASANSHDQVSESVQAKYVPRNALVTWQAGCKYSYLFSFERQIEGFALVREDYTPKPVFTALKNLIALVKDTPGTFTPGTLAYAIHGNRSNLREALLQKRDGSFILVLWREIDSDTPEDQGQPEMQAIPVTVTLPSPMMTTVYAPVQRDTPVQPESHAASVTVQIADAPVCITIRP